MPSALVRLNAKRPGLLTLNSSRIGPGVTQLFPWLVNRVPENDFRHPEKASIYLAVGGTLLGIDGFLEKGRKGGTTNQNGTNTTHTAV